MRRIAIAVAVAALVLLAGCAGPADEGDGGPSNASVDDGRNDTAIDENGSVTDDAETDGSDAAPPADDPVRMRVATVGQGGTLQLAYAANQSVRDVALWGVATPTDPEDAPTRFAGVDDTSAARDCLAYWGRQGRRYLLDQYEGVTLDVRFAGTRGRVRGEPRPTVRMEHGDTDVGEALLRRGYAAVRSDDGVPASYRAAERTATNDSRGVWECRDPEERFGVAEVEFLTPAQLNVTAIAAEGGADEEYVVIQNTGYKDFILRDYTLADGDGNSYRFPARFRLPPGTKVTLYTGRGEDTDRVLHWDRRDEVWDDDGDVVQIRRPGGATFLRRAYGDAAAE